MHPGIFQGKTLVLALPVKAERSPFPPHWLDFDDYLEENQSSPPWNLVSLPKSSGAVVHPGHGGDGAGRLVTSFSAC
jgi:hypothetical protein